MKSSMSRILIETVVRKTIRDIKESPERSVRNLVDMGLEFSEGRFQKYLFQTVQTMLMNEKSPYYRLVADTVSYADEDRLFQFCMNLGYNSCTIGASVIRQNEKQKGFNIPWNIIFEYKKEQYDRYRKRYYSLISEGEQLGIFTYMIKVEESNPTEILSMIAEFPDSAFFLICKSECITEEFVKKLTSYTNIMLLPEYKNTDTEVYQILRNYGLLYGLYITYPDDIKATEIDLYCKIAEEMNAMITVFSAEENCSGETKNRVLESVRKGRIMQKYRTVLWELYYDNCFIDEVISDDSCFVYFDKNGNLKGEIGESKVLENNLYHNSLQSILMRVFQK